MKIGALPDVPMRVRGVTGVIAPTHNLRYRLGIDRNHGTQRGLRDVRPGDEVVTEIDQGGRQVDTIIAETVSGPACGAHA